MELRGTGEAEGGHPAQDHLICPLGELPIRQVTAPPREATTLLAAGRRKPWLGWEEGRRRGGGGCSVIVGAVAEGLPEEVPSAAVAVGRDAQPSERPGEGRFWQVVGAR